MRLAHILLIACIGLGCGGGSTAAPGPTNPGGGTAEGAPNPEAADDAKPPTMPLTGAPEDLLALFEGLAKKVTAAGSDCKGYASAVKSWVATNSSRYRELRDKVKGTRLPAEEEKQFDSRLAEAMSVIVSGASTCGENDSAWAAFQAFDTLIES